MTQRHEMAILGAPPAVFTSAALLSPGITGCACTEKWYTWNRLAGFPHGSAEMCDYSLQHVRSRPAKVGDKLTTRDFGTGTRGFAASEDAGVAVCVLPGTELSFAGEIRPGRSVHWAGGKICSTTEQRFFGKSTKKRQWPITMRSNSPTARSCY